MFARLRQVRDAGRYEIRLQRQRFKTRLVSRNPFEFKVVLRIADAVNDLLGLKGKWSGIRMR